MHYNRIQPYRLSRRMCPCYQYRLCILRVKVYDCWCKLVPLEEGGPCGIRGRILMPRFCSSIPQHLGPVVWAPRSLVTSKTRVPLVARRVAQKTLNAWVALRSLVTTDLSSQGHRTPQGGRCIGSWQPVAVLLTEAGLPHCLFPLDPLHLFFFFFFMNGNTERAQCALSLVCIPQEIEKSKTSL